jgi:hypothetical protein
MNGCRDRPGTFCGRLGFHFWIGRKFDGISPVVGG